MANPTANAANSNASAGTALRGRIEAIGIFDLLRIAVTQCSSGRLLVFNDQFDAELYYDQGRLVAVMASSETGRDALKKVMEMAEGEFEFAGGLEVPSTKRDPALHEGMMQAIKGHYQERVRARQDSATGMPAVRSSGVHRMTDDASGVAVAPIVNVEAPTRVPSNPAATVPPVVGPPPVPKPPPPVRVTGQLLAGERGRAIADTGGRANARLGEVTPQEATLVALTAKTAQGIAAILGMRELQRFEICGTNDRSLLCRVAKEGIYLSAVNSDADQDAIWRELGT